MFELPETDPLWSVNKNLRDAPPTRFVATQAIICAVLGLFAFISFCVLRCNFPNIFMARLNYLNNSNKKFMPPLLPVKSLFGWIPVVYRISEHEVLEYAGLDAYVFLGFFRMSIKLLSVCLLFAVTVLSPVRYHFTGNYDQGGDDDGDSGDGTGIMEDGSGESQTDYKAFMWIYVVFTYLFTFLTQYYLLDQTKRVVSMRQKYLGQQNSVTDRTIRLSGIPPELRDETVLKDHIESFNIGKVSSIVICREWQKLNHLFRQREIVIEHLEYYWAEYLGRTQIDSLNIRPFVSSSLALRNGLPPSDEENRYRDETTSEEESLSESLGERSNSSSPDNTQLSESIISFSSTSHRKRPVIKTGFFGYFGKTVDAIDFYSQQLAVLDDEIVSARKSHYPATPTAFVTMDSVATAQMVAQAVLDPHVHFLITRLAPAPHDVIWENVCLPRKDRILKVYYITVLTGLLCVAFIIPVSSLATLLNLKTISKFWPDLGDFLERNVWAQTFVTEMLPVYLFTFLNFVIPYLYVWLSSKQGFVSYGEEELSIVSKNFFYVFVNLFLVFTMAGTASNYWGYLSDTKKLALQLAASLRGLAGFYVDTILLQGLGMMPYKLLLLGQLVQFPYFRASCRTPRQFKELYKPPLFNFGLQLPRPLLILVITIIYSVMSTKILASGLLYFIIGFYVYKYQLIYSCVHPQHSTGKVWPIIFRRVVMGLLIFQLTMAGSLTFTNDYILATCLAPLPLLTVAFLWNFQRNYLPLSFFIALRAIKDDAVDTTSRPNPHSLLTPTKSRTIDERREFNQNYQYPYLVGALDGPWVALDGDQIIMVTSDGTVRKRYTFNEY
ncbi:unnamed protein product [Kuraishia capsulata CBS 1993]|uniref:CSC1/OSCA1-like 7TM region domain-containing protein n=1 Tax=Kuraishia capsulata CBS 1993 TaxID=1382522 RepID=W6MP68_9ASCO|nr:uncharacterized protein KUCA_T00004413001 [Kuraishia capsulata CBS 1993]CDK28431.1 unnamed protein product [Kuraishia capsulata CBS 1993]